jgi:hypothetical protein
LLALTIIVCCVLPFNVSIAAAAMGRSALTTADPLQLVGAKLPRFTDP